MEISISMPGIKWRRKFIFPHQETIPLHTCKIYPDYAGFYETKETKSTNTDSQIHFIKTGSYNL